MIHLVSLHHGALQIPAFLLAAIIDITHTDDTKDNSEFYLRSDTVFGATAAWLVGLENEPSSISMVRGRYPSLLHDCAHMQNSMQRVSQGTIGQSICSSIETHASVTQSFRPALRHEVTQVAIHTHDSKLASSVCIESA